MDLKINNKILKSSAVKNPATEKCSNNLSANKIMIALITAKINQKLQLLLVMLKKQIFGFTNIFNSKITIATIMADV